jgi:hypothetical protein
MMVLVAILRGSSRAHRANLTYAGADTELYKKKLLRHSISYDAANVITTYSYCEVFGRMPSLLGNLKFDTPVVGRQPKVKHFHGYARHSVLSRCMICLATVVEWLHGYARHFCTVACMLVA